MSGKAPASAGDPLVRGETFQGHWQQLRDIATNETVPSPDDMVAVLNLLEQMIVLLRLELQAERDLAAAAAAAGDGDANGRHLELDRDPLDSMREPVLPCLDLLLADDILPHVLATSRMPIESSHAEELRGQQLRLYRALMESRQADTLISHQPFRRPMLDLISHYTSSITTNNNNDVEFTKDPSRLELLSLLREVCAAMGKNKDLLDALLQPPDRRLRPVFRLLLRHLHEQVGHESEQVGLAARGAALHCLRVAKQDKRVEEIVKEDKDFCPVLATSLSGLYSSLPRRLPADVSSHPAFHRLTPSQLGTGTESGSLLSCLRFADQVCCCAPEGVAREVAAMVLKGFLRPVLAPALLQNSEEELICTTAYLTLFLENISSPWMMQAFLSFLFVEQESDSKRPLIEIIVSRIGSQSKLCQVSLSLLEVLVSMECEDVLFWLVLRHLVPMRHLLPSRRDSIRDPDLHGRAAQKFLSLSPICTQEAAASASAAALAFNNTNGNLSQGRAIPHSGSVSFTQIFHGLGRRQSLDESASEQQQERGERVQDHYLRYLNDAKTAVRQCQDAARCWQYDYDGISPPPGAILEVSNAGDDGDEEEDEMAVEDIEDVDDDALASSGYTSLNQQPVSSSSPAVTNTTTANNHDSLLSSDEDLEFWALMRDPAVPEARLNRVIRKMQQQDAVSNNSSLASSSNNDWSPRGITTTSATAAAASIMQQQFPRRSSQYLLQQQQQQEDVDLTVNSLGPFLDLLLDKVELLPSNSLSTNLLVTSILSRLCAHPQPLLRSALSLLPEGDAALQPNVRGLQMAIAGLRRRLDDAMAAMEQSDAAILTARRFLRDRISIPEDEDSKRDANSSAIQKKTEAAVASVANTITHLGHEASRHKSSLTAAFSSMFKRRSGAAPNTPNSSISSPPSLNTTAASECEEAASNGHYAAQFADEVKRYALSAVLLDEWLLELAAVAQEQSVLQKERAFEVGMGLDGAG